MRIRDFRRAILAATLCGASAPIVSAQDAPTPQRVESLIRDLRSEVVEVRREAAATIRTSDAGARREALPAMIDLLMMEKDGQVRLAVLDTVTGLGREAASAVPALVHTLRSSYGGQGKEELHQDYRSALALAAVGKPAVEGLRSLLDDRKENVRAEAIMALGRIGPDAESAVPDLIPFLGDGKDRIRGEASLALGRIGPAAVGPLIAASKDREARVRARAVEALGHLPSPDDRARAAVLDGTQDAVAEVRAAATRSLARSGLPDSTLLPILKENIRHEDENLRLAALQVLVERRPLLLQMAPDLESLLTANDAEISRQAAFLLRKIGPDAAPALLEALGREGSRIDQIAEALAQIGRPVVGMLTGALESPEPRLRRGAALALGQVRPPAPGVERKLAAGLADPVPEVQAAFLSAIGHLGPRAKEAVPAVRALLRDTSADLRIQAIDILARSANRDDRLVGDLIDRLDDPDARVQRRAIDAIRTLGPPGRKAMAVVIGKLKSPHPDVRLAAAEWIASHGQTAGEAVPALGDMLDDPSPESRRIAATTLGRLGRAAQSALPRMVPLLRAEQVEVREAVASALGSLDLDADVIRPHLALALRDDASDVRRAAMRTIQRLGPQGAIFVPDLISLAGGKEDFGSVERSLRRFERRGPDARSLPELVELLKHDRASVRRLAVKFLGLAGRGAEGAIPALDGLREDPDPEIRKQAAAASDQLRSKSESKP